MEKAVTQHDEVYTELKKGKKSRKTKGCKKIDRDQGGMDPIKLCDRISVFLNDFQQDA